MKLQRTSVGLDVHARSVLGCALDGDTGEVFQRRLTPDHGEIVSWLGGLPGPVAVTYEAGPTGFGLARTLTAAGIACEVAAPSKLVRPPGDRVKTDARDAAHLARLLHLGQITPVTVPSASQEAARDLVRAREDCRGDLMSARHRVSKLLLRQGIVYSGEKLGPVGMNSGYAPSGSTTRHCSSATKQPSTPCWRVWTDATDSTTQSPQWPPIANSPRSCTGWAASAASQH